MSTRAPRVVARNAAFRIGGELLAKVASLAFFVTMARELGKDGFGEFQFALALTGALIYVAGFGTDQLLAREVARDHGRAGRLLSDAAAVKVLGGLVMLAVAAVVANLGSSTAEGRAAVYVIGVGTLLEVLSKSWHSIFQGYERFELASATLIIQRTLTAVVGIAVLLAGGNVVAAAAVYAGGAAVAVLVAEWWLHRLGVRRAAVAPAGWLPMVRVGVAIGLISLLITVLLRLDVTMLSFLANAATVGVYAVAFRLVEATQFIGWSMASAMLPWLSRTDANLARGFGLGLKAVVSVLLPIGLAFVLFAPGIIDLFYGREYESSAGPLRILGLMTVLYGINGVGSISVIARYRPSTYAKLLVPVLAINVTLNLILIPTFGARGAATAALTSGVLLAGLALWQAYTVVGAIDFAAALAGPLLAGTLMAAVALVLHAPWPVEGVLAGLTYAGVLCVYERLRHPEDARVYISVLPVSRFRAGRTTA
jgi:O-antigen/teichoic acid export membrane protein